MRMMSISLATTCLPLCSVVALDVEPKGESRVPRLDIVGDCMNSKLKGPAKGLGINLSGGMERLGEFS